VPENGHVKHRHSSKRAAEQKDRGTVVDLGGQGEIGGLGKAGMATGEHDYEGEDG
jgi:hypothetical protein